MLNHKFTLRETVLVLLCAIVGIGIFYYEFAWKTFKDAETTYDTTQLETGLLLAQTQSATMKNMEAYIEEHKNDEVGEIERYNIFHASLIVRHSEDGKLYLYDILDIKKETSNPIEP